MSSLSGSNDPFGNNPIGAQTSLHVFNLYDLWRGDPNPERARIARGHNIEIGHRLSLRELTRQPTPVKAGCSS